MSSGYRDTSTIHRASTLTARGSDGVSVKNSCHLLLKFATSEDATEAETLDNALQRHLESESKFSLS